MMCFIPSFMPRDCARCGLGCLSRAPLTMRYPESAVQFVRCQQIVAGPHDRALHPSSVVLTVPAVSIAGVLALGWLEPRSARRPPSAIDHGRATGSGAPGRVPCRRPARVEALVACTRHPNDPTLRSQRPVGSAARASLSSVSRASPIASTSPSRRHAGKPAHRSGRRTPTRPLSRLVVVDHGRRAPGRRRSEVVAAS